MRSHVRYWAIGAAWLLWAGAAHAQATAATGPGPSSRVSAAPTTAPPSTGPASAAAGACNCAPAPPQPCVSAPDGAAGGRVAPGGARTDNRSIAETLFFAARGLIEAGRNEEACERFAESYRLDPAAGTLLNLAVCQEKTGHIASAWGSFRQALNDARKSGRKDREELALQHIERLEPELPYLTLVVPEGARVAGMEVVRNGVPLQAGGWGTELPIDPGTVEVAIRAPGHVPKIHQLHIEKREHQSLTVTRLVAAPKPPAAIMPELFWTKRRSFGAALLGLGLASAGVGTYLGVAAFRNRDNSDGLCPVFDGERRCTQQGADYMSTTRRQAFWSDVSIGVGVVGLAVGTYYLVTKSGGAAQSNASASGAKRPVDLSMGLGPRGASGALAVAF